MHQAVIREDSHADQAANQEKNEAKNEAKNEGENTRDAVLVPGRLVLAREHWWRSVFMSGFARRRVSHIRRSGEHRSFRVPKY
jgi:hypothetical protein